MFIYIIVGLISALHFSSGFDKTKIRGSIARTKCGGDYVLRKTFIQEHNEKRAWFVEGKDKLPGASNMRFMAYDCNLENEAIELTKNCEGFPDETKSIGNKTNVARIVYNKDNGVITAPQEAVSQWWNTKEHWNNSQKITAGSDSAMPFLLIAKAEAGKFGCSVNLCKYSHYNVACVYEKAIEIGSDLYQQGEACKGCPEDECYQGALCKTK